MKPALIIASSIVLAAYLLSQWQPLNGATINLIGNEVKAIEVSQ